MTPTDAINPPHYRRGPIECIDAIASAVGDESDGFAAVLIGHVIRYAWRLGAKGSRIENARKLAWYAERLAAHEEGKVGL